MDKTEQKELNELKKLYKAVRLGAKEGDVAEIESRLKTKIVGEEWDKFLETVERFLESVAVICQQIATRAEDRKNVLVAAEFADYEKKAKELGSGALIVVRRKWNQAMDEQSKCRPESKCTERAFAFYWKLPREWERAFHMEKDKSAPNKLEALLFRYCWASLWEGNKRKAESESMRNKILTTQWPKGVDVSSKLGEAEAWIHMALPVVEAAFELHRLNAEIEDKLLRLGDPAEFVVRKHLEKGKQWSQSIEARGRHIVQIKAVERREANPALDGVDLCNCSNHPNDITGLEPSNSWTAYLDESYRKDEENPFLSDGKGVMAGVVFHSDNPLPDLPPLHCSQDADEDKIKAADKALEKMLHHPNCGVLAVPSFVYDVAMGWDDMVASWVDIVLRILPMPQDNSRVAVTFCVEPCDEFQRDEDFIGLKLVCEKSLKQTFPERARRVDLAFKVLPKPKEGQKNGNAYPDIIGHTCRVHDKDKTAKQRYQVSEWARVCHFDVVDAPVLHGMLRSLYQEEPLEAGAWSILMRTSGTGLLNVLAMRIGERAKNNPKEWALYLEYLHKHLVGGKIDMALLKRQVAWMKKYYAKEISKRDRLVWLTAQLALANHEGKINVKQGTGLRSEFDQLCGELFEEMAPVVGNAVLNLAVAYTNEYQFEMALGLIHSLMTKDPATVGLANHGKLLSSAGQHFAFMGMAKESIELFHKALDCFARLTGPRERAINSTITRGYLATITMDMVPDDARCKIAYYLLGKENVSEKALLSKIRALAIDNHTDKYQHHILLRYLMTLPETDPLREAYCQQESLWCPAAVSHPWEMIEFYRALLTTNDVSRSRHFENAYQGAIAEGGETLKVIAAVIAGSALALGVPGEWQRRLSDLCAAVKTMTGLHADGRYDVLFKQSKAKLPPLELAKRVLPFNFR